MAKEKTGNRFEDEVRRAIEAEKNLPPGACQPEWYTDVPGVHEIDGRVDLGDTVHVYMMTTQRKLDKVRSDAKKLAAVKKHEEQITKKAVVAWLVTSEQLQGEQLGECRKHSVTPRTIGQIRSALFDGRSYLVARKDYPFGSADVSDTASSHKQQYIRASVRKVQSGLRKSLPPGLTEGEQLTPRQIARHIRDGVTIVLVAPFGSGKSLTSKQVFDNLENEYYEKEYQPIPVYINLRDHAYAEDYEEIFERHCKRIGIRPKDYLVRGWRTSSITIILDGYDEIVPSAVAHYTDENFLRAHRRQCLASVRDLISHNPDSVGLLINGRDHYFDSDQEMEACLGVSGKAYVVAELLELDDKQIGKVISPSGEFVDELPDWIPRKPLLVSHLSERGLLEEALRLDPDRGLGAIWDEFVSVVVDREASLTYGSMEPGTVRLVLEDLAELVRCTTAGDGPIAGRDLSEAFGRVTGGRASDAVLTQLQRLPGLTQRQLPEGERAFVDWDLLSALQGSAAARYIQNFGNLSSETHSASLSHGLSELALSVGAQVLGNMGVTVDACVELVKGLAGKGVDQRVADIFEIGMRLASQDEESTAFKTGKVDIIGASVGRIDLDSVIVDGMSLDECVIEELSVGQNVEYSDIRITNCIVVRILGVEQERNIPSNIWGGGNSVEVYEGFGTNNSIMQADLEDGVKVGLTILRKVYKQAGTARTTGALKRGMSEKYASFVDSAIKILETEGWVVVDGHFVRPVRRRRSGVERVLSMPRAANDDILKALRKV